MALRPGRIGIWNVGFYGGRKTGVPGEKPSEQGREPTTNSTHILTPGPGIGPEPYWWKASALTTAPSLPSPPPHPPGARGHGSGATLQNLD